MSGVFDGDLPLTRNASAAAVELIRSAILEGRLPPGHRLKEGELASELGISRTPIREALFVLQAEGLVEATPNRGAAVRSYELDELREMYDLRAVLEGHAARRAATRLEPADVDELRASCDRFAAVSEQGDVAGIVAENLFFHRTIHEAADSPRLVDMVRQTIALPLVYRTFVWYSPEQTRLSLSHHRQLVAAFEQRDAARADDVMREHALKALDTLVAHVTQAGGIVAATAQPINAA
jgi:DNA-binding GntR family transcriptional regulator